MDKTLRSGLCALVAGCVISGAAQAQEAPYEIHPELGYLGCFETKPTLWGATLEQAMQSAEMEGAHGFLYWPERAFAAIMIGEYPASCTTPPDRDWHVYLASEAMIFYQAAKHGIDGCDIAFGEEITNTTLWGMFVAGRSMGAPGFVFDGATATGRVTLDRVPDECSGPVNPAQALYVAE